MGSLFRFFNNAKYIAASILDKVMEFNNSWEDPWDSPKKGK